MSHLHEKIELCDKHFRWPIGKRAVQCGCSLPLHWPTRSAGRLSSWNSLLAVPRGCADCLQIKVILSGKWSAGYPRDGRESREVRSGYKEGSHRVLRRKTNKERCSRNTGIRSKERTTWGCGVHIAGLLQYNSFAASCERGAHRR